MENGNKICYNKPIKAQNMVFYVFLEFYSGFFVWLFFKPVFSKFICNNHNQISPCA